MLKEKLYGTLLLLAIITVALYGAWYCSEQMELANKMMRVTANDSMLGPLLAVVCVTLFILCIGLAAFHFLLLVLMWEPRNAVK